MVGNTIQTLNSHMHEYIHEYSCMVTRSSLEHHTETYIQHKVVRPWLGANLQYQCISQHTTESAHYPTLPVRRNLTCELLFYFNQRMCILTIALHLVLGIHSLKGSWHETLGRKMLQYAFGTSKHSWASKCECKM